MVELGSELRRCRAGIRDLGLDDRPGEQGLHRELSRAVE